MLNKYLFVELQLVAYSMELAIDYFTSYSNLPVTGIPLSVIP